MPKSSPARRHLLLLGLALAALSCERPFVETDPVVLTESAPDLSVVQAEEVLPLRLRVSDAESVVRVTVNGEPATRAPEPGLFLDTLRLEIGLNTVFVAVFDDEGNVTEDTLYAVHLSYGVGVTEPLPRPRYEHTATALADGSVLLAGGFEGAGADSTALLAEENTGRPTYTLLADGLNHPRGGHTATLLPDGRVLLLGGATRSGGGYGATDPALFVPEAEVFDPVTRTFSVVPFDGEPLRRHEHAALALAHGGRVFVYVYGGVEASGNGAAPTGTLAVLELRQREEEEVLTVVSPPGGVGGLPAAYGHVLVPLLPSEGLPRALAVGADVGGAEPAPFALHLTFRPSSTFFPFEIASEAVAPPDAALAQFAAALVAPGLVLLSGGQAPPLAGDGSATNTLLLYADAAGRFFTFPGDVRLHVPRSRHTATLLPSGRILVVGGVGTDAAALPRTELIGPN